MLTVGSVAMRAGLIELGLDGGRIPKDVDMIIRPEELDELINQRKWESYKPKNDRKWLFKFEGHYYEVEIAWPGTSAEMLLNKLPGRRDLPLRLCLLMKLSHRYRKNSPHFLKTMADIRHLRRVVGPVTWTAEELEFLRLRESETYTYAHPKLSTSKDEFFADRYAFDHDSIHRAIAVGDRPAFEAFSSGEVMCDMSLFEAAPYEVKINAVYEEACVLAIERAIVPHGTDPNKAFLKALERVCTSITSGRFREFAWENYDYVVDFMRSRQPFLVTFVQGVASGVVQMETRE